jgi:hypothetical protein
VLNGLLAQLINLVGSFAYLKIEVPISLWAAASKRTTTIDPVESEN